MKQTNFLLAAAFCGLFALNYAAHAQGTAFSYQGRLNTTNGPANGSYDLTFTLFNTNVVGGPAASIIITNTGAPVSNGLFMVSLDFGEAPFTNGAPLWLEIEVRSNGVGSFFTLAPRQEVLSAPYAAYAYSANAGGLIGTVGDANLASTFTAPHAFSNPGDSFTGNGSGLTALNASNITTGTIADARLSTNVALLNAANKFTGANNTFTGNVGVGTTTPQVTMDLNDTRTGAFGSGAQIGLTDFYPGTAETAIIDSIGNGGGYTWRNGAVEVRPVARVNIYKGSDVTSAANVALTLIGSNGNVGIGTVSPSQMLEVNGNTKIDGALTAGSFTGNLIITNGSVGIGTNAPLAQFEVLANQYGAQPLGIFAVENCGGPCGQQDYQENIRLINQNPNGQTGLGFLTAATWNLSTVPDAWIGTDYGTGANNLKFSTQSGGALSNRMYIVGNTGFVGIGTTSPGQKLEVNGNAQIDGALTVNSSFPYGITHTFQGVQLGTYIDATDPSGVQAQFGTISDHNLGFVVNNGEPSMTLTTNGNIGIGTFAPANRLDVQGSGDFTGNVGIGTTTPTGHLSVVTQNGTVSITDDSYTPDLIMTGGPVAGHLRVRNCIEMWPDTAGTVAGYFDVRTASGTPTISLSGSNGVVTCTSMSITSDRNAKKDFKALNSRDVLAKVIALPITEWQYKIDNSKDAAAPRHIGPMAQDFSAAFALNEDDRHISVGDEGGVALAAIQGLNEELKETRAENAALKQSLAELKTMMEQIQRNLPANQVK